MLTIIASVTVRDGAADEFESVASELCAAVRENEPGNSQYEVVRLTSALNQYRFIEAYDDRAALSAHAASPHYRKASALMEPLLASAPVIEICAPL